MACLPNAPQDVSVDQISVGTEGSEGLKVLAVAPVLLIANGMLPSSTPVWVLLFVLQLHLHSVLSISLWFLGRENEMRFVLCGLIVGGWHSVVGPVHVLACQLS